MLAICEDSSWWLVGWLVGWWVGSDTVISRVLLLTGEMEGFFRAKHEYVRWLKKNKNYDRYVPKVESAVDCGWLIANFE